MEDEQLEVNGDFTSCLYVDTRKYQNRVGVCFYNSLAYEFLLTEFIDNDHFTVLESLFVQKRPSVCLFNGESESSHMERVFNLFKIFNIDYIPVEKKKYDSTNINEEIKLIIPGDDDLRNYDKHLELTNACKCFMALINYVKYNMNIDIHNKCKINIHHVGVYLRLDKAAMSALDVLPKKKCGGGGGGIFYGNRMSILKFLDKCNTSTGSKKLLSWLTQPLTDSIEINKRLDIVETLINEDELRNTIFCHYLKRIPELDKLNYHLKEIDPHKGFQSSSKYNEEMMLKDIVKLYYAILDFKDLYAFLIKTPLMYKETWDKMFINPLHNILIRFQKFIEMIEMTIDLEAVANHNEYLIQKKFDDDLDVVSEEKNKLMDQIKKHKDEVEKDIFSDRYNKNNGSTSSNTYKRTNKEDVKLVDCNTNVFLFRVTKKDGNVVHQKKKRYKTVRLNKNEYLFTTNTLMDLCKKYEQCLHEYNMLQSSIVRKAIYAVSTYAPVIEMFAEVVSTLDVLTSFSVTCYNSPFTYVRPIIEKGGDDVILKKSRHPLLELPVNGTNFIPNDIHMNKQESRLIIITGPNMGGKSTYIRQVAMTFIFAQIGMYVPCDFCKIPIFNNIMCRVGASDFQLKGISTFLAEMIEVSAIIKNADESSFIIVDELGRGTSTCEGLGISWAIAKHILDEIKCFCLFATHFHEISKLAFQYTGAVNRHVETTTNSKKRRIIFLYEIKDGACDKSYGVNVAEIAKLPAEVIRKAYEKVEELESAENKYYLKEELLEESDRGGNSSFQLRDEFCDAHISKYKKMKNIIDYLFASQDNNEFTDRFVEQIRDLTDLL